MEFLSKESKKAIEGSVVLIIKLWWLSIISIVLSLSKASSAGSSAPLIDVKRTKTSVKRR